MIPSGKASNRSYWQYMILSGIFFIAEGLLFPVLFGPYPGFGIGFFLFSFGLVVVGSILLWKTPRDDEDDV